jgi:uncharacterized protein (DUF58 family)
MGTRRIVLILALTGAAAFYVLYPFWFSGYLFAVLLLLMPFDLIISLPGMLTRRVVIAAPAMLEQGVDGTLAITTLQNKRYPARCIKIRMRVTGDDYAAKLRIVCSATQGSRYEMPIDSSHCGVTIYEIRHIWIVSLLGIFALPVPANRKAVILILPTPVKPPRVAALPRGVIFRPKPGGGFSEDYDLRPYRLGDMIRNIHWKISAKLDALIVREPLSPPPHSRLVLVSQWNGARERDLALGRLRWISDYLLKWEMPYYVRIGEEGTVAEITHKEDLFDYIYRALGGAAHALPAPASLPAQFAWVFRIDGRGEAVEA